MRLYTKEEWAALQARRAETWITTAGGRQFFPWFPEPHKIEVQDLAHTLSQINRWGGHTREPYSVAQHSVEVAGVLRERGHERKAAWGLLHDATEAFMGGDIVSPIKRRIPELMEMEAGIANAVTSRFGLPPGALEDHDVKAADRFLLAWEYRDLMPQTRFDRPDDNDGLILGVPEPMRSLMGEVAGRRLLLPWSASMAERAFIHEARVLGLK